MPERCSSVLNSWNTPPASATPAKVESMAAHVLGLGGLSSSRLTRVHTASAATVSGRDGSP